MIFITLGTSHYPFERVVNWLNVLLDECLIDEPIFFQYGVTDVSLIKNHSLVTARCMLSQEEINKIIQNSRLIISHAGQGSTRKLAKIGKPFIIIPREKRYGEHVDDHQLYFARNVNIEFGICYCDSLPKLQKFLLNTPKPIKKELFVEEQLANHLLNLFPPNFNIPQNKRIIRNIFRKKQKAL